MALAGTFIRSILVKPLNGSISKQSISTSSTIPNLKFYSTGPSYEYIKTEVTGANKNVAIVTLNRPKALNALCDALMKEFHQAVLSYGKDSSIAAIVVTGNEKAFAAGADIKEMQPITYADCVKGNFLKDVNAITTVSKPIIAAVNGFALGGGCELVMMCDIIYAGENAKFGQLEVTIGTMPGVGGTQRLTKAVGKSKAMELCLTGNVLSAQEAQTAGLVSKVFPPDQVVSEAIKLAEKIGTHSQLAVKLVKEAVNASFETSLSQGLLFEKKLFHGTFALEDRKEGMTAFVEKRAPKYTGN